MNSIESFGADPPRRTQSAPRPPNEPKGPLAERPEEVQSDRVTNAEVLAELADRAQQRPPVNLSKLSAAAAKFLLTSLEPAMEIAQRIRAESVETTSARSSRVPVAEQTADRDAAATLLAP